MIFVGVAWGGVLLGVAQDQDAAQPPAETVEFRRIRADDYANFPVNWSSERPYRVGLIRSLEGDKKVEELDVATGQWLLPAVATAADDGADDGAGGERSSD